MIDRNAIEFAIIDNSPQCLYRHDVYLPRSNGFAAATGFASGTGSAAASADGSGSANASGSGIGLLYTSACEFIRKLGVVRSQRKLQ